MNENTLTEPAEQDGVTRFVVGAVVVRAGKALLLQRRRDDFLPGIYELPSGQVEDDEGLWDALCREVREETSLTVTSVSKYLGHFDYFSRSGKLTRQFNFLVSADGNSVSLTDHEEYRWVSLAELATLSITQSTSLVVAAALA